MERGKDVVMLATADWDNPFWTNKQHDAVQMAAMGCRVLYVESVGLRRPSASRSDIGRIIGRIRRALSKPRLARPGIHVCSPLVIPMHGYAFIRRINRVLLSLYIRRALSDCGMTRDILWSYNPMTTRLLDTTAYKKVVYHCVDEIGAQPGMPAAEIRNAETEFLREADITFVTSSPLLRNKGEHSDNIHLFENVADYAHFSRARSADTRVPDDLASLPPPVIGFIGAVSPYKLDFALLSYIASAHPEWSIVLIGRVGEGEPGADASVLAEKNIHLLGPRPYADLPACLKGFDLAIVPAALNEYTHSMFPMKLFEYMAAGKAVVSTDIESLRGYADSISIAQTRGEFVRAIESLLATDREAMSRRLVALAEKNTYRERMRRMMHIVSGLAPGGQM